MTLRGVRSVALGLVLVAPALAPAFATAGGSTACASGRPHAALVVDTGTRTTTYCVRLDTASVTGLHLIQLAAAQYGLDYRFGFGGQAVCELDGVGTAGADCFGAYPDFWGYWHGAATGGWTWAGSGAGSSSVRDGGVEGWSWGSGDSGATHPQPPRVRFDDVCTTPAPSPRPRPSPSASPSPSLEATQPSPTRAAAASTSVASRRPRASRSPSITAQTPVATTKIVRAVPTSGTTPSAGGPPVGAIVTAIAVTMLGVAGWLRLRRIRSREGGA